MTLSPKWGIWISAIAALLAFVAISTAQLTTLFDAHVAGLITAWAGFLGGAINAVNVVLHMIPSQSGPVGAAQFPLGPKQ
jgi:hypothetical protein